MGWAGLGWQGGVGWTGNGWAELGKAAVAQGCVGGYGLEWQGRKWTGLVWSDMEWGVGWAGQAMLGARLAWAAMCQGNRMLEFVIHVARVYQIWEAPQEREARFGQGPLRPFDGVPGFGVESEWVDLVEHCRVVVSDDTGEVS